MEFSVTIESDEDGFTGRECPDCEKYFKIKFGTGIPDATDCHCPYCNHIGPQDEFWTQQQIEYAKSVALRKISGDLLKSMKKLEMKPDRNAFISIGIKVEGRPTPIAYYSEKELEEKVCCNNCTLHYTIYGAFGHCPDCGIHNSQQIVNANFDLVEKLLNLAANAEDDVKSKLIENALEDSVSAFDGFGREHCSKMYQKISFQNIDATKNRLQKEHSVDISASLDTDQWDFVTLQFQKRHLLAHKMGVIDEEFVRKTGQSQSLLGRKVSISEEDVRKLVVYLKIMAENLFINIIRS